MSWYYDYYISIQNNITKKIDMLGPFDINNNLHCVFSKSRSFASDLWEDFYPVNDLLTDKAIKKLWTHVGEGDFSEDDLKWLIQNTSYLPLSELPKGDYIKKGYFLIEDITRYEEDHDPDVFYEYLTPTAYNLKMQNELKFGFPKPKKNKWGEEYVEHSCSEYAFYMYPDYYCKEYESFILNEAVEMLAPYGLNNNHCDNPDNYRIVIVCTQG